MSCLLCVLNAYIGFSTLFGSERALCCGVCFAAHERWLRCVPLHAEPAGAVQGVQPAARDDHRRRGGFGVSPQLAPHPRVAWRYWCHTARGASVQACGLRDGACRVDEVYSVEPWSCWQRAEVQIQCLDTRCARRPWHSLSCPNISYWCHTMVQALAQSVHCM